MDINDITRIIIGAAIKVHAQLGPGLLESVYQPCLQHELMRANVRFTSQCALPICYGDLRIDSGLRIDLLVENLVVVELKAVEKILPIHHAQLLTYLRLSDKRVGLLINFNVRYVMDGVKRIVNRFDEISASSASSAV